MSTNGIGPGISANASYQQALNRAQNAGAARPQRTPGEYDQSRYLRELNERLDARVIPGAWNGKDQFGSEKGSTVMIHPDFLRKMYDDPELGAKYETEINTYAKLDAEARKRLEAQPGMKINSSGMYIDEKGEMHSYMVTTRTSEGPKDDKDDAAKAGGKKTAKELMEEMLKKLEEKRQEEKVEAERVAEAAEGETAHTVDTFA